MATDSAMHRQQMKALGDQAQQLEEIGRALKRMNKTLEALNRNFAVIVKFLEEMTEAEPSPEQETPNAPVESDTDSTSP